MGVASLCFQVLLVILLSLDQANINTWLVKNLFGK